MNASHLVTISLLCWGWKIGLLGPAVVLIAIYELPRRWGWQVETTHREWRRAANLMLLATGAAAIFPLFSQDGAYEFLAAFQSANFDALGSPLDLHSGRFVLFALPMTSFVLVWMGRYGSEKTFQARIFRPVYIGALRNDETFLNRRIAPEPVYLVVLLASASATDGQRVAYLGLVAVLIGAYVWSQTQARGQRRRLGFALAVVTAVSFVAFDGILWAQRTIEREFILFAARFADPTRAGSGRSRTTIGRLADVKGSGQILLRIRSDQEPPELLRTQSYHRFERSDWVQLEPSRIQASVPDEDPWVTVAGEEDLETWLLRTNQWNDPERIMSVAQSLKLEGGALPAPEGILSFANLPVGEVRTNLCGGVQAVDGPGLLQHEITYIPGGAPMDLPPLRIDDIEQDLSLVSSKTPQRRVEWLVQWARSVGMQNRTVPERVRRIEDFFIEERFRYTTHQEFRPFGSERDPVLGFLTQFREGHCEYFATATVLLLRASGVPARYATGYSVQERRRPDDNLWIVRGRHAHAWAIYWDGERWRNLDTTPADWREADNAQRSALEPMLDRFRDFWFSVTKVYWAWALFADERSFLLGVILVSLIAFLFYRLLAQRRVRDLTQEGNQNRDRFGLDSEFYRLQPLLERVFGRRSRGDSLWVWAHTRGPIDRELQEILRLHYRYRFDPEGLRPEERRQLQELCLGYRDRARAQIKAQSRHGAKTGKASKEAK